MATPTSSTPWEYSDFTGNANVDALISGTNWSGSTITYSFPSASAFWSTDVNGGYGPSNGSGEPWSAEYSPLAPSDEVAVRAAFASWGAVVAVQFSESVDNANTVGDIRLAYTYGADIDGAQAYAYLPSDGPIAGDVWFNARGTSYTEEWTPGSYEAMTAMHEIGHALGLKHPFEWPNVLDSALDTRSFTVMSYSAAPGDQGSYFSYEPTTPMVLDIAAIQQLYGVNTRTGAGNTTYTFQSGVNYHQTIWDSGGTDTLVYQSAVGGEIDLNSGVGGGSAMGATLYVYNSFGQQLYSYYNIWIADGTVIENATGGSGADVILGNQVANVLLGGAGNDSITAGAGNDSLDGGSGVDTLVGGSGNDSYTVDSLSDVVSETSTLGTELDTVITHLSWTLGSNLEKLTLTGTAAVNGTGNSLANILAGNGAANVLNGGTGADKMYGGGGNDTYYVDNLGDLVVDSSTVAGQLDTVNSSVSFTLGANIEKLTLTGTAALNGTGNTLGNILAGNGAANVLNGLTGADTMYGGGGNDTYYVDNLGDSVIDSSTVAGQIDTVISSVSFTLGANIEKLTLTGTANSFGTGNTLANTLVGNSGGNVLAGGTGADTVTGGAGADIFVLSNTSGSDLITDFVTGIDDLRISQAGVRVGDGDTVVEGAVSIGGPGGFSSAAEFVVVTGNIAGSITTASAAAAIGSASSAYAVGATRLFAVDNGSSSALYLFTAADANSVVSAGELTLLASLQSAPGLGTGDLIFGG